jgi:hypothetical protein
MENNYNADLSNLNLLDDDFSYVSAIATESTGSNLAQSVASQTTNSGIKVSTLDSFKELKIKNQKKSKFVFTKPYTAKLKNQDVDFKIGEIVEGVVIRNEKTSEPPNFFQFSTKYGDVRLGFGGRASSVIAPYTETVLQSDSKLNAPDEVKTPEAKTPEVEITQEDDKILGMPKGLAIGLGIALLAVGGYIAYKKFKK